jgi:hypothetical protein
VVHSKKRKSKRKRKRTARLHVFWIENREAWVDAEQLQELITAS